MKKKALKLSKIIVWIAFSICILPLLFSYLDLGLSNHELNFDVNKLSLLSGDGLTQFIFYTMSGPLTHTILEWSVFCITLITLIVAIASYRLSHDIAIPLIGLAIFFSGAMDAFHMLASNRLLPVHAGFLSVLAFTGAISRLFNALIMMFTVGFLALKGQSRKSMPLKVLFVYVAMVSAIAAGLMIYISGCNTLPGTQSAEGWIMRPYSVALLVIYGVTLLVIYPKFYKLRPSLFAHALILGGGTSVFRGTQCTRSFQAV